MLLNIFIKLAWICALISTSNSAIDPFSMDADPTFDVKLSECSQTENNLATTFYKRSLNMILNLMQIDHDKSTYNGQIYLELSVDDFNLLKSFAKSDDHNVDMFHRVDTILSQVYSKSLMTSMLDKFNYWFDTFYMNICNRRTFIIMASLLVIYISYKLLKANLTLTSTIKHLLFLAWLVDYVFTWLHLLEDAEINKTVNVIKYKNVPIQCDPTKMSYWEKLFFTLSSHDECKEYYNTILKEEFWTISPFIILSEQFKILIKTPIVSIGTGLSEMFAGMMAIFPWYLTFIIGPLLMVTFLFFASILLSFATDTPFGVKILNVIQVHFGHQHRHPQLTGERRPEIEEIKNHIEPRASSSKRKKSEKKMITLPTESESEENAHEEIRVCIRRKNKKPASDVKKEGTLTPTTTDSSKEESKDLHSLTKVENDDCHVKSQ